MLLSVLTTWFVSLIITTYFIYKNFDLEFFNLKHGLEYANDLSNSFRPTRKEIEYRVNDRTIDRQVLVQQDRRLREDIENIVEQAIEINEVPIHENNWSLAKRLFSNLIIEITYGAGKVVKEYPIYFILFSLIIIILSVMLYKCKTGRHRKYIQKNKRHENQGDEQATNQYCNFESFIRSTTQADSNELDKPKHEYIDTGVSEDRIPSRVDPG
jgi:hypothetical protein